ncbi:MAG: hypothetical protein Q7T55_19640, partial [Solirubrobacteraceae bacterium]|nr:hypothetical protein [Solirubrobacteraceae bacterium]
CLKTNELLVTSPDQKVGAIPELARKHGTRIFVIQNRSFADRRESKSFVSCTMDTAGEQTCRISKIFCCKAKPSLSRWL